VLLTLYIKPAHQLIIPTLLNPAAVRFLQLICSTVSLYYKYGKHSCYMKRYREFREFLSGPVLHNLVKGVASNRFNFSQ